MSDARPTRKDKLMFRINTVRRLLSHLVLLAIPAVVAILCGAPTAVEWAQKGR